MPDCVPVSALLAVSVAVIDCVPGRLERGSEECGAVIAAGAVVKV